MADSAVKAHCPRHGSPLPPACPECLALLDVDAESMNGDERAAELEALGGVITVEFDKLHRRVEQLVGRPVWTHELGTQLWPTLVEEARTQRHPADLAAHVIGSLDQVAGNKPVIVAKPGGDQRAMTETDVQLGRRRLVWWDGALWWRTYQEGGFDGYRTLSRRLACGALAQRMQADERRRS